MLHQASRFWALVTLLHEIAVVATPAQTTTNGAYATSSAHIPSFR